MYVALIAVSSIIFMRVRRRTQIPIFMAPLVVGILVSITSMIIYSIMIFSASIGQSLMPDTIQLFTAIAIIAISGIASKLAFLKRKMPPNEARLI
jgi:hypothetical protein